MDRRTFGFLAGTGLLALKLGTGHAKGATDANLLKTTLTPMGGLRAGSADGSIPAWTGGYTTIPAGWTPKQPMPDVFAHEPPIFVINSSNMSQHADRLTDGIMVMMRKFGFSIKVYPTHRTASAPQAVYDNIALNVSRAKLDPAGPRWGFTDAFGGIPFPIPDLSDPLVAGSQIMWNHLARWESFASTYRSHAYSVSSGQLVLGQVGDNHVDFPYYYRHDLVGRTSRVSIDYTGPANVVGERIMVWDSTNSLKNPNIAWELLNGQGRVRKTPELSYDTPSSTTNGIANYDEYNGFIQSQEKYDWKYLGKKEVYIPYNNNGMFLLPAEKVHLAHFIDPNVVRWELHRVWVVEATLHPGQRNVLARRRFYIDEDTFAIANADAWDANNNLYHVNTCYNILRPELPGTVKGNNCVTNMQTGNYTTLDGPWDEQANPSVRYFNRLPDSIFDPQSMAASGQY